MSSGRELASVWAGAALLLALTFLAAALRLSHLDHGLPQAVELDLKLPVAVERLRAGAPLDPLDREAQWYPLLLPGLVALLPSPRDAEPGAALPEHLEAAAAPVLQVRLVVALLGALLAPLTFLLARRFLAPGWSLAAAALVATSLLHVGFSQQARPHAASATTFVLAVLTCMRVAGRGDALSWLAAGAACGFALGTLQSGIATLLALGAAYVLRARAGGRWIEPRAALAVLAIAASLLVFYPHWFVRGASPSGDSAGQIVLSGHRLYLDQFDGRGFRTVLRTLVSYDPMLLALALLGLAWCLIAAGRSTRAAEPRRREELHVALAFALPYLLVIGLYSRTYERFVIPLLPFVACLAAFGLSRSAQALATSRRPRAARGLALAMVVLALGAPALAALRFVQVQGLPHTTELAAQWLVQHLRPEGQRILLMPLRDLPLARDPAGFALPGPHLLRGYDAPWARYQARQPPGAIPGPAWRLEWLQLGGPPALERLEQDPLGFLRATGADLALIEVVGADREMRAGSALTEGLRRGARRLARLTPDRRPDYSDHALDCQEPTVPRPPLFLPRVLQARGTGAVLELYDLHSAPEPGRDDPH